MTYSRRKFSLSGLMLALSVPVYKVLPGWAQKMLPLQPIPPEPPLAAEDSVTMQDPATFVEVKLDFPIAAGPFEGTWDSINTHYPGDPTWLREAKFGIWVHFGPQSAGQSGDWYARKMYQPGTPAYENHLRDFGHPSQSGYKDVLHTWNPTQLDPAKLVRTYHNAGARFLIIQGVHHDNFDNWNSAYQPWNAVNMGPKRDLLGEWAKASRAAGMRYGVAFHHEYTWWWWQPAFGSDTTGSKAGVPYDAAHVTLADGKGKWWEGYDPRLLYGINLREYKDLANVKFRPEKGIFQEHLEYAHWYTTRWSMRILDVMEKYDPDFFYTDGDTTQPFNGEKTGTGYRCDAVERVIANFYNRALAVRGSVDKISVIKFHSGTRGVANTFEGGFPKGIKTDQAWIGENAVGDWFYAPNFTYSARGLVLYLLEVVSRDGIYAVNVSLCPDGSLDAGSQKLLADVGDWMKINGEGIYGSKAWVKLGEGVPDATGKLRTLPAGQLGQAQAEFQFGPADFRFTQGKDGSLYAFALSVPQPGAEVTIVSLGSEARLLSAPVKSVSLLGSGEKLIWSQNTNGLVVKCPALMPSQIAVAFKIR